jgi:hypothetical protein
MAYQKKKQKRIFPWVLGFLGIVFVALLVLQMITDPKTSLNSTKGQIYFGLATAL